jgi:hypothetical protein
MPRDMSQDMPETTNQSLNLDVLVGKHLRLVPACRMYQFYCSLWPAVPILLLLPFVLAVAFDLLNFGTNHFNRIYFGSPQWPVLEFNTVSSAVHQYVELARGVDPRRALRVALLLPVAVYFALSFVCLRITKITLAVILVVLALAIADFATRLSAEFQLSLQDGRFTSAEPFVSNIWFRSLWCYFFFVLVMALRKYFTTTLSERALLREAPRDALLSPAAFLQAFGIPKNLRNSSRPVRTVMLAYLGNLAGVAPVLILLMSIPLGYLVLAQVVDRVISDAQLFHSYDPIPLLLSDVLQFGAVILFLAVLVLSFAAIGRRCLAFSRRFLRVSLEQAQIADPRPPVLFLRSFRDDAVALPPLDGGFAYRLFDYAAKDKSLDELLLEEGTALGPVVALGNPSDAVPPYGAARGYAGNRDWRKMVADLMRDAAAIVICVDDTENLWWEVERTYQHAYIEKTLLLLHPKYRSGNQAADIFRKVEEISGLAILGDAGAAAQGKIIGLWMDAGSALRIGTTAQFSRAHYLLMLRWFLRSKAATGLP